MLTESFVCYRVIDLVENYVYYTFVKLYFLELYFKTFIRIWYTVIVLYLPEILFIHSLIYWFNDLFIYLFIYLFVYLFILFIRYLSEIYLPKIYQVIFPRIFYILWIINKIFLSLSYIIYRKEQSKIRGKSWEKIGREYDQISQIIKSKCFL